MRRCALVQLLLAYATALRSANGETIVEMYLPVRQVNCSVFVATRASNRQQRALAGASAMRRKDERLHVLLRWHGKGCSITYDNNCKIC